MAEKRQRLPHKAPRRVTDNREDTSRADGASLALGSTEYRERVADLRGMDEFEQEAQKLDEAGFRQTKEFSDVDERTRDYDEKVGGYSEDLADKLVDDGYGALTTGERVVSHEIQKGIAAKTAFEHARAAAAETETKKDDRAVARRLPHELKEAVYDEGKDVDDIYPGMSTIEKYL